MNILSLLTSSLSQGLLWSLLAIGVFITYRILDVADLTAEGSYPLGAGIAAISIVNGYAPVIACIFGFLGGAVAGLVTGILHTKLKIPALVAGIITMTGLYSVTSRVMGAPNLALIGQNNVFTFFQEFVGTKQYSVILTGLIFVAIIICALVLFFKTEIGLAIRATGDNIAMSEANGIKTDNMKLIGYALSNGCIALAGSLLAQNNNFADLNSGTGTIVIGLASIIIAEVIFRNQPLLGRLITIVLGASIYRFILALVFEMNVQASDSRLASAVVLALCLALPEVRKKLGLTKLSKKGAA